MTTVGPLRVPLTASGRATTCVAGQARLLVAVMLLVAVTDQLVKAWAWRHVPVVHINSGSGLLFGDRTGAWYRDDGLGAALDTIAVSAISALAALLLRRRRPPLLFLGAAMMLAGWASNLADRLGLHEVTAPGTGRGVVDFLRWGGRLWNLADLFVIAGAVTCVLAAAWAGTIPRPDLGRPDR
jgi:lipoprotein signal peptidase